MIRYFPGEQEAIETVKRRGAEYGYVNLISRLKDAWSEYLQSDNAIGGPLPQKVADRAAQHVCVWCGVDGRTGKKAK